MSAQEAYERMRQERDDALEDVARLTAELEVAKQCHVGATETIARLTRERDEARIALARAEGTPSNEERWQGKHFRRSPEGFQVRELSAESGDYRVVADCVTHEAARAALRLMRVS